MKSESPFPLEDHVVQPRESRHTASARKRQWVGLPQWALSNATAAAAIIGAGLVAFVSTWFLLSPVVESVDRTFLIIMIVGNILIAAAFAILVSARVWHVWSERQNARAGSHTQMRLLGQFAAVAVLPALIAFLFAFTILRTSLNDVFSERIDTYKETVGDLANGLVNANSAPLVQTMANIATDVDRLETTGLGLEATPIHFKQYLKGRALLRNLDAIYLMDGNGNFLIRIEATPAPYELPSFEDWSQIISAAPGDTRLGANDSYGMFRAVVKLNAYQGGLLLGFKKTDPGSASLFRSARAVVDDWQEAALARSRYERVFLAGYIVLAVIILFGAMWLALGAASRIVEPIGRLVDMSEKVSGGDLGARVEVYKDDGELGGLARSINHMTAQLQTQRNDLIETNRQFDNRRRFTEAVLSGVSAGVVGSSKDGRITIANRQAAEFFDIEEGSITGTLLHDLLPEIGPLFNRASFQSFGEVSDQIEVERHGQVRSFNVRIVGDNVAGEKNFVITFDDITELIGAQRSAAWGDVARRIAHEIKNPLTPIQLSAERLRRKYLEEVTSKDIFDKCTDTIIRHVGDIGRMVDEFSSFARMPTPVVGNEDLRELIKAAVFSQRVAFPDIDFETKLPNDNVVVECDGRLIVQAIGNLVKNAGESVGARVAANDSYPGKIKLELTVNSRGAFIEVFDNGIGLPTEYRHRLTEPYMTTRTKGTGLGLAIVRKVLEDHGGSISFQDTTELGETGARVALKLPFSQEGGNSQELSKVDAAE